MGFVRASFPQEVESFFAAEEDRVKRENEKFLTLSKTSVCELAKLGEELLNYIDTFFYTEGRVYQGYLERRFVSAESELGDMYIQILKKKINAFDIGNKKIEIFEVLKFLKRDVMDTFDLVSYDDLACRDAVVYGKKIYMQKLKSLERKIVQDFSIL